MSRLSDALRRAGQGEDQPAAPTPEDVQFFSAEDARPDEESAPEPELRGVEVIGPGSDSPQPGTELVPLRSVPPAVHVSDSGSDVQVLDVIRALWRRKWLMGTVVV